MQTTDQLDAFAFEQVTVDATAGGKSLTAATYMPVAQHPAASALITAETAEMRYTYDGTAPTASVGHLLPAGGTLTVYGTNNIRRFRAIRTGGASGLISVTYHR